MKRIYSAGNLPEAHLLSHLLERAGIRHHVFNENLQGGVGELPFTHAWPEIWIVDESDTGRALEIIRGYERPGDDSPPRECPSCGENSPAGFEICWACGDDLGTG